MVVVVVGGGGACTLRLWFCCCSLFAVQVNVCCCAHDERKVYKQEYKMIGLITNDRTNWRTLTYTH